VAGRPAARTPATLNSVNFNRNIQGRNAFYEYLKEAVGNSKSMRTIATEVITGSGNNYAMDHGQANFRWPAARRWADPGYLRRHAGEIGRHGSWVSRIMTAC